MPKFALEAYKWAFLHIEIWLQVAISAANWLQFEALNRQSTSSRTTAVRFTAPFEAYVILRTRRQLSLTML